MSLDAAFAAVSDSTAVDAAVSDSTASDATAFAAASAPLAVAATETAPDVSATAPAPASDVPPAPDTNGTPTRHPADPAPLPPLPDVTVSVSDKYMLGLDFTTPCAPDVATHAYVLYYIALDGTVLEDDDVRNMARRLRVSIMVQWALVANDVAPMCVTRMRLARVAGYDNVLALHCNMRVDCDADMARIMVANVWALANDTPKVYVPTARGVAVCTALVMATSLQLADAAGTLDDYMWVHDDVAPYLHATFA